MKHLKRMVATVVVLALLVTVSGRALAGPTGGGGWDGRIARALLEMLRARHIVEDTHRQAARNR